MLDRKRSDLQYVNDAVLLNEGPSELFFPDRLNGRIGVFEVRVNIVGGLMWL